MAKKKPETMCILCGTIGLPAEYHPYAFCVLAKVIGSERARENINAVLDHGRALERAGLPNDTRIGVDLDRAAKLKAIRDRKSQRSKP